MSRGAIHEDLQREKELTVGSDRAFALTFAAFFALIGVLPIARGASLRLWPLAVAVTIAIAGLVAPRALHPLNVIWSRFGLLLNRIVSPIVMGLVFYVALTPMGMLARKLGKDTLRLRRDSARDSYWIVRTPPGPGPDTLKNQF